MCDTRLILFNFFFSKTSHMVPDSEILKVWLTSRDREQSFPTTRFLPQELNHKFSARPKSASKNGNEAGGVEHLKFNGETCQPWRRQRERVGSQPEKKKSKVILI